jgi:hypothetical protein
VTDDELAWDDDGLRIDLDLLQERMLRIMAILETHAEMLLRAGDAIRLMDERIEMLRERLEGGPAGHHR